MYQHSRKMALIDLQIFIIAQIGSFLLSFLLPNNFFIFFSIYSLTNPCTKHILFNMFIQFFQPFPQQFQLFFQQHHTCSFSHKHQPPCVNTHLFLKKNKINIHPHAHIYICTRLCIHTQL